MSEQLVFESTMDALLRAAGAQLTTKCTERLKSAGFNVSERLRPAYPASVWAESVRIIGEENYGGVDGREGHRRLGARAVDAFAEGVMGSAMFGLLRVIGPTRTIGRMTKNLRTGCNYLDTRATQVGPNEFDIWMSEVNGVDGFYQGLLEAGLRHVGAKGLKIVVSSCDTHQCTFRANWDA